MDEVNYLRITGTELIIPGWRSIRIYAYAAKKGELETLQEKRKAYIQDYNENAN